MNTITREDVKQKKEQTGAKLVEVLDEEQFQEFHLPDAVNVPLGDDFDDRIQVEVPNKYADVIVYCHDEDCPASEKAAKRMEALGYENIHLYEGGKMDWKQAGLPIET